MPKTPVDGSSRSTFRRVQVENKPFIDGKEYRIMRLRIEHLLAALAGCLLAPSAFADATSTATSGSGSPNNSTNTPDKVGYALGVFMGVNATNTLKRLNFEADNEEIIKGLRDVLAGQELRFSPDQARQILNSYQQERQREAVEKMVAKNTKEGEAFLAENKKKEGVKTKEVTLSDGKTAEFQYKVITEGTGEIPKSNDMVTVKYRGTLVNGTEFNGSDRQGGQSSFQVNGVVRGWSEALQMMRVGSKWQLFIPANLGYGESMQGGIEPGSTLIYEVELLSIGAPKTAATGSSQQLTSDIVRVPSEEERKQGRQPEIITPEEAQRIAHEEAAKQQQQKKQ